MRETIELVFLVICLLASLTSYLQRPSPLYLRVFPFYFIITILVQYVGAYMSRHSIHNIYLYNTYSIFEFAFYFFILREIALSRIIKRITLIILIAYPILAFANIYFFQKNGTFHSVSFAIGCSIIVILCIIYFVELFQLPKTTDLKSDPAFWVCTAILFSYVCTFPFWGLLNFVKSGTQFNLTNLMRIQMIINILSYSLFTIAFLCRIRIRKSTL
jgi:hypothetical protein